MMYGRYMRLISERVRHYKPILAEKEAINSGKPIGEAEWDIDDVAGCFEYFADLAEKLDDRNFVPRSLGEDGFAGSLCYEPVGVVAGIVPWNYPLLMFTWKVAPAIAGIHEFIGIVMIIYKLIIK